MKTPRILPAIVALLGLASPICSAAETWRAPGSFQPVALPPGTRNPFAQGIALGGSAEKEETSESEETRLKKIIKALKVAGVKKGGKTPELLLGPFILTGGTTLPQLIANQTETLVVSKITDTEVTLKFVEKDKSVNVREIPVPYDLTPKVAEFFYGDLIETVAKTSKEGKSALDAKLKSGAVEAIEKNAKDADYQGFAERKTEMMGVHNAPTGGN
jgi:hypothetical protein